MVKRARADSTPNRLLAMICRKFRCKFSFFFEPAPGGIPERHPFSVCFFKQSISCNAEAWAHSRLLHFSCLSTLGETVSNCPWSLENLGSAAFFLSFSLSLSHRNTLTKSKIHEPDRKCLCCLDIFCVTLEIAWKRSSLIGTSVPKTCWIFLLYLTAVINVYSFERNSLFINPRFQTL